MRERARSSAEDGGRDTGEGAIAKATYEAVSGEGGERVCRYVLICRGLLVSVVLAIWCFIHHPSSI